MSWEIRATIKAMLQLTGNPFYDGLRPRSLSCLMDLYESNYMRLRKLIPQSGSINGAVISHAAGATDLHLDVLERSRYTTTLSLTYYFDTPAGHTADPGVVIRIYHDARLAEVMSFRHRRHGDRRIVHREVPEGVEAKWRINRFLQKWLGFCLRQGHAFEAETLVTAAAGVIPEASTQDSLSPNDYSIS
jgi:uncharacterized protein YqiB (DUF1249 family)